MISVILFCTIFASIWGDFFGGCAAAAVVFFGISICTSQKQKIVSERVASDHTALAGQLAAAL